MAQNPLFGGAAALLCLAGSLAATGCVEISATDRQYVASDERRFAVSGAPEVTLSTFDGSIEVRTWDRPEVLVVTEKRGPDREALEAIRIEATQQDNVVDVKARYPGSRTVILGFGRNAVVHMVVTVPIATTIKATTGDGRIDIRDVTGTVIADSGDGAITMQDVVGDVDAQTGDGRIRVDGRVGHVKARSGDGAIAIHAYPGSEVREEWSIATGDGSIVLEVPPDLRANIDAHSGDGRVVARDLSVAMETDAWEGYRDGDRDRDRDRARERRRQTLRGPLNGGGGTIRLRTGDGSITLSGS